MDEGAGAQAAAAAHGDEPPLAVGALEFVQRLGDQDAPGAAQGVAQGNGAAVGIHPLHVGLMLGGPTQHY